MSANIIAGIDIGGTKTLITLFNQAFKPLHTTKFKMDKVKSGKALIQQIDLALRQGLKETRHQVSDMKGIGVGCAGIIDVMTGKILFCPNIKFMNKFELKKALAHIFKIPVWVENDVNAGLYGEYVFGTNRKSIQNVVGVFIGTGIGGAMILNGSLYRGLGGAGEIGHTWLNVPTEILAHPNQKLTLEGMAGRLSLASELGKLLMLEKAPWLKSKVGTDVKKIKSNMIKEAIRQGDTAVKEAVLEKSRLIGLGLANVINILHPQKIILGGGVVEALSVLMLPEIKNAVNKYALKSLLKGLTISPAKLRDLSVVYGAGALVLEHMNTGKVYHEK